MTHLLAVTSLVCENIGFVCKDPELCETYAMIAILHDAIEDQGGLQTYHEIHARFGPTVADGILALSDSTPNFGEKKPSKSDRNAIYAQKLQQASPEIALISCCDKIHNLRSMLADFLSAPSPQIFWSAFSASPTDTLANYQRMGLIYKQKLSGQRILSIFAYDLDLAEKRMLSPHDS